MDNSKKIVAALGLMLTIMGGGISHTLLTMEPVKSPCTMSKEIIALHEDLITEIKSLSTLAINFDFLTKDPLEILSRLQYGIDWLVIQLNEIDRENRTVERTPGAMSTVFIQKAYDNHLSVLRKIQALFNLIKKTCNVTNEQISEIRNKLYKYWLEEYERGDQQGVPIKDALRSREI